MSTKINQEIFFYDPDRTGLNKFSIPMQKILKKLCKTVNADPYTIDFSHTHWYWRYKWDERIKNKFRDWMYYHLCTNKDAREAIMSYPNMNKADIMAVVDEFIFNFGWKE